ncbi:MAG: YlxQ-related RNA-binding protein [Enterococcus sp.]
MKNDKLLNLLGLAQRAGKLVTGEGLVIKEVRMQRAKLVFVANDAGKNTLKKVQDKSTYYEIPFSEQLTSEELSHAIGKPRMVVAVMDQGFAKKMKELING